MLKTWNQLDTAWQQFCQFQGVKVQGWVLYIVQFWHGKDYKKDEFHWK